MISRAAHTILLLRASTRSQLRQFTRTILVEFEFDISWNHIISLMYSIFLKAINHAFSLARPQIAHHPLH